MFLKKRFIPVDELEPVEEFDDFFEEESTDEYFYQKKRTGHRLFIAS